MLAVAVAVAVAVVVVVVVVVVACQRVASTPSAFPRLTGVTSAN